MISTTSPTTKKIRLQIKEGSTRKLIISHFVQMIYIMFKFKMKESFFTTSLKKLLLSRKTMNIRSCCILSLFLPSVSAFQLPTTSNVAECCYSSCTKGATSLNNPLHLVPLTKFADSISFFTEPEDFMCCTDNNGYFRERSSSSSSSSFRDTVNLFCV